MTLIGIMFFLFSGMDASPTLKEDLKVIHQYQAAQKAAVLAQKLTLTPAQIDTLLSVRKEIDALKSRRDQLRANSEKEDALFIKSIRAVYESGSSPTPAQLNKLKEMRRKHGLEKKRFHLGMQMATLPLEGLLSKEQRMELMKIMHQRAHKKAGPLKTGNRTLENRKRRNPQKAARHWNRILLSDAFIQEIQQQSESTP
jgi:hypothetical protein